MAHELEIGADGQAKMIFQGSTPWHSLGVQLEESDLYDWEASCKKAGMDTPIELVPLMTSDTQKVVDRMAVRRTTDGNILGTVGTKYTLLQNRDAFKWFQPFLETKQAQIHTAGSLRGGSRIWVLAKLNLDPIKIATGDEVEKYLLLSHSHDGTLAVRVGFSPVRVVCSNTLSLAHSDKASKLIRLKHSKDLHENLENVREIMNLANQEFEASAEQYRLLATKNINQEDLKKYVKKVLKLDDDEEISTRMKNTIDEIMTLCDSGLGNQLPSVKGTYWTAYNGINEWLGYQRGNSADNRLNSLWFGEGTKVNKFALETALEMVA